MRPRHPPHFRKPTLAHESIFLILGGEMILHGHGTMSITIHTYRDTICNVIRIFISDQVETS